MKKTSQLLTFVFFLITIASNCKKESDSRDGYVGNYNFTVEEHIFNFNDSTYFDTIIFYPGRIYKPDNASSNYINIGYLPDMTLQFEIDENGTLKKPLNAGLAPQWSGKFQSRNSVTFSYYLNGTTHNVTGTRY